LPSHIDVVIRRSIDQGKSWSQAFTIAGDGVHTGFGDPALVVNRKNGEIICLFASDKGFFNSTSTSPIRIYQSKSADNGITWSSPIDITPQLYGAQCTNPFTQGWQGAFVSSGSALQLKAGRIMAVLTVRESNTRSISNYVMYSDDNANTWKVSTGRDSTNGNESKMVELDNGKILMSIRTNGTRMFNQSKDYGRSWGIPYAQASILDPNCNGDLIRYTSVNDGYKRNRLLHSIPYSGSRKNVSVLMSYDEGVTWPVRKTIYAGASAYSALTILSDGTIGMYYEVGEYETYQMYFARFSLSWLTDGADVWTGKLPSFANSTGDLAELESGYTVFPNPAQGLINLSGTFDPERPIEIYNSLGILMGSVRVKSANTTLQLSLDGYPAGVYFVKNGAVTRQLLVVE
jgi:Neuraminidase (sialidase)